MHGDALRRDVGCLVGPTSPCGRGLETLRGRSPVLWRFAFRRVSTPIVATVGRCVRQPRNPYEYEVPPAFDVGPPRSAGPALAGLSLHRCTCTCPSVVPTRPDGQKRVSGTHWGRPEAAVTSSWPLPPVNGSFQLMSCLFGSWEFASWGSENFCRSKPVSVSSTPPVFASGFKRPRLAASCRTRVGSTD